VIAIALLTFEHNVQSKDQILAELFYSDGLWQNYWFNLP
jgi:hypothetical protein